MFIAIAQIEAMRVLPFDLRTDADTRDALAYGPLLDGFAQPLANAQSAMAFLYDQTTQFYYIRGLQVPFDAGICPSHNGAFQNRNEGGAVG